MNQLVINLLTHPAQAIGLDRGTVTVRTATHGVLVWSNIADTGSGIEKASQAHIFDQLYTFKPVDTGTGPSLSVSYGIVQKHHSPIPVRAYVGEGMTFRVELTIAQPLPDADELTLES